MKQISTVGIVGFGVMGAAIGINAAMSGYQVIYKELNEELVGRMFDRWVITPLEKKVAREKITRDEMENVVSMIRGTADYRDLSGCDLIIEAAVEKMDLKTEIFEALSRHCREDAILVTNTSTFPVEKLMKNVRNRDRTAGLHYFFPANVNRLVEVIRHRDTSDATYDVLKSFAEKNGKIAITVRDFPGFAINPVFISAYMVLDAFYDGRTYNAATLEHISQEALGIKYGIMWVQNGAGLGTCYHAAQSMNEYLSHSDVGYPPVPPALKRQFENGKPWDLEDGPVLENEAERRQVADRLLGAVFSISAHLIEKEVVSPEELELGICTALAWPKGPFTIMNEMGMAEVGRRIRLAAESGDFKMPARFSGELPPQWELG